MEREGRKRQCPTEEMDASNSKRLCCDLDGNVEHVFNQILSEMDANDVDSTTERIEEDLVRDMMNSLQQEIMCRSSCEDESITSNEKHEATVNGEGGSLEAGDAGEFNSYNVEFEYLFGASDDELGIPTSPESDLVQCVNYDCFFGCDYNSDYGFFEWHLMEGEVEQQLLLQNLWDSQESNDVSYFLKM